MRISFLETRNNHMGPGLGPTLYRATKAMRLLLFWRFVTAETTFSRAFHQFCAVHLDGFPANRGIYSLFYAPSERKFFFCCLKYTRRR